MAKKGWTIEDEQVLKDHYNYGDGLALCCSLLKRTTQGVKQKARRMGLSSARRPFTSEEKNYIARNYEVLGPKEIAANLNRHITTISNYAYQFLGLKVMEGHRSKITRKNNLGRIVKEETRKKIGKANRKYEDANVCLDCGREIGRPQIRCRTCNLKSRGGENHPWWKGGVSSLYQITKKHLYPAWIYPVMVRDGFACQDCGTHDKLEVHHLRKLVDIRNKILAENPWFVVGEDNVKIASLIVLDHNLDDGITLCYGCHKKRHFGKSGELQEHLTVKDEGNLQRSGLNVLQFVGPNVQRLTSEDAQSNNEDTSAGHGNDREDIVCSHEKS